MDRTVKPVRKIGMSALKLGLDKVPLTNGGFRKLKEVSVKERQKPLIFKTLTERISRFWKKNLTAKNENGANFFFNGEYR